MHGVRRGLPGILALVCLLVAAFAPVRAAAEIGVRDVRFGQHSGYTRFVLEVDGVVRPDLFTLAPEAGDPYRVVLDLPSLDWKGEAEGTRKGMGLVSRMRHGRLDATRSRVVLDLPKPAAVKTMMVLPPNGTYGARIVVDLVPTDRTSF
ncbi:MAG: AMIN domain-containing protein, partial [Alphaproteobacteria bacterium]|nr:AMIN domain-containing protein [Alphaproteobacteria bacterium]